MFRCCKGVLCAEGEVWSCPPLCTGLDVPSSLNQLASRAPPLASYFSSRWADRRAAVLRGSWRLLLSPPSDAKITEGTQIRLLTLGYLTLQLKKAVSKVACPGCYALCYTFLLGVPVGFLSLGFYYLLSAFPNSSLLWLQLKLGRLPPGNLTVNYHTPFVLCGGLILFVRLVWVFFRLGMQCAW